VSVVVDAELGEGLEDVEGERLVGEAGEDGEQVGEVVVDELGSGSACWMQERSTMRRSGSLALNERERVGESGLGIVRVVTTRFNE